MNELGYCNVCGKPLGSRDARDIFYNNGKSRCEHCWILEEHPNSPHAAEIRKLRAFGELKWAILVALKVPQMVKGLAWLFRQGARLFK